MPFGVRLHVWGEYARYTRPEMKVERVSYDVMTPRFFRAALRDGVMDVPPPNAAAVKA